MLNPTLNLQDQILQRTCPAVAVPRFGTLQPLTESGHRFLVASDGLWIEVRRPWLHLVWPVGPKNQPVAIPYGELNPVIDFSFVNIPGELISMFIDDARQSLPNEFAAWITWNEQTGDFTYRPLTSTSAGPAHLNLNRPLLPEYEHLVMDIHSHAAIKAFFSREDNRDDTGEIKLSLVIGSLGQEQKMSSKIRLCANGVTVNARELAQAGKLTFKNSTGANAPCLSTT